jgi:predicted ATPase
MIDWSCNLLDENQQTLLGRLSVFRGGWRAEAAEQVCAANEAVGNWQLAVETGPLGSLLPTADCLFPNNVFNLLLSLVDKSLVVAEERGGTARYRLLETVHQYARERLVERGGSEKVSDRHLDYFLSLAEEAAPKLAGPEQAEWFQRLEEEHENLRAALNWSLKTRDGETGSHTARMGRGEWEIAGGSPTPYSRTALLLCGALWRFWFTRGHLSEGLECCSRAFGKPGGGDSTTERAKALNGAGNLAFTQGDRTLARAYHEESLGSGPLHDDG